MCASEVHDLQVKSEMSPRDSSSHHSPSHLRCQSNLLSSPTSISEVDLLSAVFESVHAPGCQQQQQQQQQQGSFPGSDSSWPFHSPVQSLGDDSQSPKAFPISLHPDISSLPLNSRACLAGVILDPDTSLTSLENEQSFDSVNHEEQLTSQNPQLVLYCSIGFSDTLCIQRETCNLTDFVQRPWAHIIPYVSNFRRILRWPDAAK